MTTRALQFDMLLAGLTDNDGNPCASYVCYFYEAGTTTAKNVYGDKAKTAPHTSRTLDSSGRVQCYGDGLYKIIIKDASGTTYKTYDNVYIRAANFYARTVTGNTTATVDDDFIMCNTNGGQITVTLMEIADGGVSHPLIIKRNGSNNVVIDGGASETVDGSATYTISTDKRSAELISDGTNWQISGVPVATMWDADEDTGIQVEESADDDTIRFDVSGTEQVTIQDGKIEPTTDNDVDLGSSSKAFKTAYVEGINFGGISTTPISGDSTAGRIIRASYLQITDDGDSTAGEVQLRVFNLWNGHATSAVDDIAKGATSSPFVFSAGGTSITISTFAFAYSPVAVLGCGIRSQDTGVALTAQVYHSSSTLVFKLLGLDGVADDISVYADAGNTIEIWFTYVADGGT